MLNSERHIIEKVSVDVKVSSMETAEKIKSEINDFIQNEVLSIVDSYLSDVSSEFGESIIQLDKVSLSIDTSSWNVHSKKMKTVIRNEVKKTMDPIIERVKDKAILIDKKESFNDQEAQVYGKEARILKSLFHFLDHGNLPWWLASLEESRELFSKDILKNAVSENLEEVAHELNKRSGNLRFRERLMKQLPSSVVLKLMAIKLSSLGQSQLTLTHIEKATSTIQKIDLLPKGKAKKIVALIWEMIEQNFEAIFQKDAPGVLFQHVHNQFFASSTASDELDSALKSTYSIVNFMYVASGKEDNQTKTKSTFVKSINEQVSADVWKRIQTTKTYKELIFGMNEQFKKSILTSPKDNLITAEEAAVKHQDVEKPSVENEISDPIKEDVTSAKDAGVVDLRSAKNENISPDVFAESSPSKTNEEGISEMDRQPNVDKPNVENEISDPIKKDVTSEKGAGVVDLRSVKDENISPDAFAESSPSKPNEEGISEKNRQPNVDKSNVENEASDPINKDRTNEKDANVVDLRSEKDKNTSDNISAKEHTHNQDVDQSILENEIADPIEKDVKSKTDFKVDALTEENETSDPIKKNVTTEKDADVVDFRSVKSENANHNDFSETSPLKSNEERASMNDPVESRDFGKSNLENEVSDPNKNDPNVIDDRYGKDFEANRNDSSESSSSKSDEEGDRQNEHAQHQNIDTTIKDEGQSDSMNISDAPTKSPDNEGVDSSVLNEENSAQPKSPIGDKNDSFINKDNIKGENLQRELEDESRLESREDLITTLKKNAENSSFVRDKKPATLPDAMYVNNAGLVLLTPFLPALFKQLDLISKDGELIDTELAACILHYAATGREGDFEFEMAFEKYLCGIPPMDSMEKEIILSEIHKEEVNKVLNSVIAHWSVMNNKPIALLQNEFLTRSGKLIADKSNHRLVIEKKTFDLLLDKLPWSYSMVKFSWKKELIFVEW